MPNEFPANGTKSAPFHSLHQNDSDLVVSAMERNQNFMGVIVPMIENTTAQERAEANFKKKTTQLVEGQKAWAEYKANVVLVREKTARLRALRLAREAGG